MTDGIGRQSWTQAISHSIGSHSVESEKATIVVIDIIQVLTDARHGFSCLGLPSKDVFGFLCNLGRYVLGPAAGICVSRLPIGVPGLRSLCSFRGSARQ